VVPCYNEEEGLLHLRDRLEQARGVLAAYEVSFVFVDDGSTDATGTLLAELFGSWGNCRVVTHPANRGLTAAFLTGLAHARAEVVCCIDSDCTYDPCELARMVPLLREGVDLVTASPYHPQGGVRNVPAWRLRVSRAASWVYRRVLRQKLATYTSCFRVYRKSALAGLRVRAGGFHGITELLARLDLQGSRIVEFPTVLDVRAFGQSKMRVLRVAAGHLRLLARLLCLRLLGAFTGGLTPCRSPGRPARRPARRRARGKPVGQRKP
jgi:dolichol-phosphate mannosyltransferase